MFLQAIDLFCGVGGLTHGLINSGIQVVAGIDIDPTCEYAYITNNNSTFILSDVAMHASSDILNMYDEKSVKVLVGCAPCQPFSKLQKNEPERTTNSKWGLLYSFLNHINYIKPDIVSMENVPQLKHEKVFDDFVNELTQLGYHVSYKVVDASDYGVPQRRRRLILLASKMGAIYLINPTHTQNKVTVRQAIGHLPQIRQGETHDYDFLHRAAKLSDVNVRRIQSSIEGGTWMDWDINLLPVCYRKKSGATYKSVYGRMIYDDVSPTLTTQFNRYGTGRYGHPDQDRAISLREGALLQSFPETYQFVNQKRYNQSDIARQIGNAVPVRLGEIIGESIINHLKGFNHVRQAISIIN